MYAVDFQNQLNDYLMDERRKIPDAHLNNVCCIYQQDKTCRYVALSKIGFVCMKKSPAKKKLDQMANNKKMVALSDNCEGLGDSK